MSAGNFKQQIFSSTVFCGQWGSFAPKSHGHSWQGSKTQEHRVATDWCFQITKGEDHCNSEIQEQHRGADVTWEETGFSPRILAKSAGFNTSKDMVVVQPHEYCFSTWLGAGASLERVTPFQCSLPPVANPPLVYHSGTAGPGNICSCKSRKDVWTQGVKYRPCTMSVGFAVPFVVGWMVWKCSGSRNGSETEELHNRTSRGENTDKSYCPQRDLLANKHD